MVEKHLDAKGKGEYSYDYRHDTLMFKTKDREYAISLEFDNLVLDIDKEGFITGMRLFDASKVLNMVKMALRSVRSFEFNARVEGRVVTVKLQFLSVMRNRPQVQHGQDFVREALRGAPLRDSEVVCTVA